MFSIMQLTIQTQVRLYFRFMKFLVHSRYFMILLVNSMIFDICLMFNLITDHSIQMIQQTDNASTLDMHRAYPSHYPAHRSIRRANRTL